LEKTLLSFLKRFVREGGEDLIHALLMCLCLSFIIWKVGSHFLGGHLRINEKKGFGYKKEGLKVYVKNIAE
jgi:hypothetical protein